ncbi:hypothetical protein BGZ73_007080, partial [Actinomortierella ambigua]
VDSHQLRENKRKQRAARLESLRRHAHWIRHLERHRSIATVDRTEVYTILVDHCRSLESIDTSLLDEEEWILYKRLVEFNPGLGQLTIPNVPEPVDYQPAVLLSGLAFLTRLVVDCPTTLLTMVGVLEACPFIEHLVIGCNNGDHLWDLDPPQELNLEEKSVIEELDLSALSITATDNTAFLPPAAPFQLRQLKLEIPCTDPFLVHVLARCPFLEQLSLHPLTGDQIYPGVCRLLSDHRLPRLTGLTLTRGSNFWQMQHAILSAVPPDQLRVLALLPVSEERQVGSGGGGGYDDGGEGGIPGNEDLVRLLARRQHQSLEYLNLSMQTTHPEAMLDILALCSRLKGLVIKMREPVDIRYLIGRPWVCTELEELVMNVTLDRRPFCSRRNSSSSSSEGGSCPLVSFNITAIENEAFENADQQRGASMASTICARKEWERVETVFMRRIGTLTHLRRLILKTLPRTASGLTFTLANGLGHLAGLTRLDELVICDRNFLQDEAGLQFMKDHWPRIRVITFYSIRTSVKRWLKLRWPQLKVIDVKNQ